MQQDPQYYKDKIVTIPNLMSILRLLLIPLIMWQYVVRHDYGWTVVLLIFSGVTDVADGFIARKFHMISDLGKAIDPVADKLTQMAMLYCLISRFPHMMIPLAVMAIKESVAAVLALMVIQKTGVVCGAVWHGKLATVLLYLTMIAHFLWIRIPVVVSKLSVAVCTVAILFSAVLYGYGHIQTLRRESCA